MHLVTIRDAKKATHRIEVNMQETAAQASAHVLSLFPGGEVLDVEPKDPEEKKPEPVAQPIAFALPETSHE